MTFRSSSGATATASFSINEPTLPVLSTASISNGVLSLGGSNLLGSYIVRLKSATHQERTLFPWNCSNHTSTTLNCSFNPTESGNYSVWVQTKWADSSNTLTFQVAENAVSSPPDDCANGACSNWMTGIQDFSVDSSGTISAIKVTGSNIQLQSGTLAGPTTPPIKIFESTPGCSSSTARVMRSRENNHVAVLHTESCYSSWYARIFVFDSAGKNLSHFSIPDVGFGEWMQFDIANNGLLAVAW